jgi:RNA polymerase sigma-70 factor (ECF subfamily)
MIRSDLTLLSGGITFPKRAALDEQVQELYDEHYASCYRFLMMTGSSADDALELLQEAFLRLCETLRSGARLDNPRNWLFRVLQRLRVDEFRRTSRINSYAELPDNLGDVHEEAENPEAQLLNRERAERLSRAVGQLTATQYQYLTLRAEGLKFREIAELHGVTIASVFDSCGRALKKLGKLTNA